MPVGVEVGTLVHRVLELDFAAPDLDAELARRRCRAGAPPGRARRRDAVVAGLRPRSRRRSGPPGGGVRLRDIARADRLDELDFELPLVGGDDPIGPALTLAAVAHVLRAHAAAGDPLAGYAERLRDPGLRESVRGFLRAASTSSLRLDGRPLRGRRLQDELARAARRGR